MRNTGNIKKSTMLLVANYESGVGYAWWLMESFWAKLADYYHNDYRIVLAYPKISSIPLVIKQSPLEIVEFDFNGTTVIDVINQCTFLHRNRVRVLYFSDKETLHWRYLLYRLFGVGYLVTHDHTPGLRTPARGIKKWLKHLAHLSTYLSVDGAIGATEFVRQRLHEVNCMPLDRCYAVPNGLPARESVTSGYDLHSCFHISRTRKILVMTGRANRYKGVDFVLKCIFRLSPEIRKNIHFLFIGDGPDLEGFIGMAQDFQITAACTFAGKRNDVAQLLQQADFAIHPSHGEVGYSLSILEYMQAGLPVIVPDNPSVCGATKHGYSGMIYPEGNEEAAMGFLIQLLFDNALRHRLGENARKAVEQYSLERTHASLLSAFDGIIGKNLAKW